MPKSQVFIRLCPEPQLSVAFNRELLKLLDLPQQAQLSRRTLGDLFTAAERIENMAQAKYAAEAQAKHLKKMESLATQEAQIWQAVMDLIERKTGKAYDQAVEHLTDLHGLAKYRGEQATFQARLNKIYRDYRSLLALRSRLQKANLYEL